MDDIVPPWRQGVANLEGSIRLGYQCNVDVCQPNLTKHNKRVLTLVR